MHFFQYKSGELYCEEVPLRRIVEAYGTPTYVYSYRTLERHYRALDEAFASVEHLICFAVKANSNVAVLRVLASLGAGMDIVSGGELYRAQAAGVPPDKIVYAGVGKTVPEMRAALEAGILMFNVESAQELRALAQVAQDSGKVARVALRVNPDVDPLTHPYVSTGLRKNKFGLDVATALQEYQETQSLPNIEVVGVHKHIGSQITAVSPFVEALGKVVELVQSLRERGLALPYLNIGGGLGITYQDEEPPSPHEFAQALLPIIRKLEGCRLILEPGRTIAGNAGVLVNRVIYTKTTPEKRFVVVDAGMNDLIRPSLYGAQHQILPVRENSRSQVLVDVVGPICESGDFLAKDRSLPEFRPGELLAVMTTGSYGFSMASNYNSRPRAAEVLVRDKKFFLIRRRETYADLVAGESIPEFL